MGIKAQHNFADILKNHINFINNVNVSLVESLNRAAQEITNLAKNTDTYTDRTNNLRSSIGYVLYKDGQKIAASFGKAGTGEEGNGAQGIAKGEVFADTVAQKYGAGYVVVLVAGMEYAAYVEAKNFDVITGATMQFDGVLKDNLETIARVTGINFGKAE